ncbi:hypothetical protein [Pseudomonas phage Astolliot]|nr:hypothetical protein [Pseudomonas phage Astolliot]
MSALKNAWNKIFGYDEDTDKNIPSIAAPENTDGAIEHEVLDAGNLNNVWRSYGLNLDPQYKTLPDMINMYRDIASFHEVHSAITDICDQAIVIDDDPVSLNLDKTDFSEAIQNKIRSEFKGVISLLDYRERGYDYFRQWYIDGRKVFFKVVDPKRPKDGIQELRPLDPRYVVKVREIQKETIDGDDIVTGYKEFYVYRPADKRDCMTVGYSGMRKDFVLPVESVVYAHSGLLSCCGKHIISYLQQAIKPANMIKMLEDAALIYMIVRAPERRVFYIDTGNLPKAKAESYIRGIMNGFKNKMVFDASTGKVKNGYNAQSMLEDFWLPRREGSKGTEITTLPGGQNMDATDLLNYYKQNLYDALQVPTSRVDSGAMVDFGQGGTEITREELKFDKLIKRMQTRFSAVFLDPLKTNLILKGIITEGEWEQNKHYLFVEFATDAYFAERKAAEMLQLRLSNYAQVEPIIGVHVSYQWAATEVLKLSQETIDQQRKLIMEEKKDPIYQAAAERAAMNSGFENGGGFNTQGDQPSDTVDVNVADVNPQNQ